MQSRFGRAFTVDCVDRIRASIRRRWRVTRSIKKKRHEEPGSKTIIESSIYSRITHDAEQDSQNRARFDELNAPNPMAQEALVLWPEHPL